MQLGWSCLRGCRFYGLQFSLLVVVLLADVGVGWVCEWIWWWMLNAKLCLWLFIGYRFTIWCLVGLLGLFVVVVYY